MKREKEKAAKAKSVSELPQRVLLNYDRGRVTMAASIVANHAWGSSTAFSVSVNGADESRKKMVLHQQLLLAIATGLEMAVAKGHSYEVAAAQWHDAERQIAEAARKRQRRQMVIIGIVVAVLVAVVGLVIIAAARG